MVFWLITYLIILISISLILQELMNFQTCGVRRASWHGVRPGEDGRHRAERAEAAAHRGEQAARRRQGQVALEVEVAIQVR